MKHLAVLSTGETIANPEHPEAAQRELRRLQRQAARRRGPGRRTKRKPSNRWRKTQARTKLLTAIANAPRRSAQALHPLGRRFDTVVIEDLNVSGMVRNRRLAGALSVVGMAELRRQLDRKTNRHGHHLAVADRW